MLQRNMTDVANKTEKPTKRGSREAILDAAEALVREQGVSRMTLDAVAAKAGLSKGGLLYNFRSKDSLLKGMIERHIARASDAAAGPTESRMGRWIAARLAAEKQPDERRAGHGMLAAIAENPDLLDPIRDAQRKLWADVKAEHANPERALIAWLAAEGLGFLDLFDTSPLTIEERQKVAAAIQTMADGD